MIELRFDLAKLEVFFDIYNDLLLYLTLFNIIFISYFIL